MILPCSLLVLAAVFPQGILGEYYGVVIGAIFTKHHDFKGMVYAANENQLFIKGMTYDGDGPAAHFWAGNWVNGEFEATKAGGTLINDEDGSDKVLDKYEHSDVLLTLPKNITDYDYFGILCVAADVDFGNVIIPYYLDLPAAQKLPEKLGNTVEGVSSGDITLTDSATIEIKNFSYSVETGDGFFAVGEWPGVPMANLTKLKDENGNNTKLGTYSQEDIVLNLPDGHHWTEFNWFVVYDFSGSGKLLGDVETVFDTTHKLPMHNPKSNVTKTPGAHDKVFDKKDDEEDYEKNNEKDDKKGDGKDDGNHDKDKDKDGEKDDNRDDEQDDDKDPWKDDEKGDEEKDEYHDKNYNEEDYKKDGAHGVAPSWLALLAAIACLAASTFVWRRSGILQHAKD